jgi:hypothetical protein
LYVNTTAGFNTLFTNPIGGGGVGMVSSTDPTANGNRLFSLGMGSVNYPAQARIEAYASQSWSSTNRGTYMTFRTTPNDSVTSLERMYIGSDGRVSVGTMSPSYRFEVLTSVNGFDGISVRNNNAGVNTVAGYQTINENGIGTILGVTEASASSAVGGANQSVLYTIGDQNLVFGTNSTERARFNNPGELLINTTTDAGDYKLQISGNFYSTGNAVIGTSSGTLGLGTTLSGATFDVNARRLIIGSGGASEGTTIFSGSSSNGYIMFADGTSGDQLYRGWIGYHHNGDFMTFGTSGTERIRLHSNGGLKFIGQSAAPTAEAGTVYYDTDDNKLKVYNGTTWTDLH